MKVENPPTRFIYATLYGENGVNCRCTIAYQVTDVELVAGHDPLVAFRYAFGYCSPKDVFSRKTGRTKALERLASDERSAVLRQYIGYRSTLTGLFLNALQKLPPVKQGLMSVPFRIAQTWDRKPASPIRQRLTPEHQVLVDHAGQPTWVSASELLAKTTQVLADRAAKRKLKTGFSRISRQLYAQHVKDKVDSKDKEAVRKAMHQALISNGYGVWTRRSRE